MAKLEDVVMSVSEAILLFGIWRDSQSQYKNKRIIVVNRKNGKVVGAFKFVKRPKKVSIICPCCKGTGKTTIDRFQER